MQIEYLDDYPQSIPVLARWHSKQWRHLNPCASIELYADLFQSHLGKTRIPTTFVALSGETLLGSASLIAQDMDIHPELSPWLACVYVLPEHRRRGVGSALVRRVAQEAQALGEEAVHLYTADKEGFYARLGWSVLEHAEYRGYQVAVMALKVSSDSAVDA